MDQSRSNSTTSWCLDGVLVRVRSARTLWNMSDEVWSALNALASDDPHVNVLPDDAASAVVDAVAAQFIADRQRTWWWESLQDRPVVTPYERQADGLALLSRHFGPRASVYLLVTDEQSEPRGVLAGPVDSLLRLVGETTHFEFAVVDPDFRRLAFDTHHNELILVEAT
jgi:hypothetical protein